MNKQRVTALMVQMDFREITCPVCGGTLRPSVTLTKSRRAYHSIQVVCHRCQIKTRMYGLSGWKENFFLTALAEDFKKARDKRVAEALMVDEKEEDVCVRRATGWGPYSGLRRKTGRR